VAASGCARWGLSTETATLDRKTLAALVDASRAIVSETELAKVFRKVAEHAAAVLGAEAASVMLFDRERHELAFETAVGPGSEALVGERFSADLGIAGQAVKTGRAMLVDDVRQNRHFFQGIDAKTKMKTRSLLAAPLLHQDQVIGVVEVLNPQGRSKFNQRDLELAQVFGNLVSAAAANAKEFDRLTRQNRAMHQVLVSESVVGESSELRHVMALCRKVALSAATVLLYGETGTGKEMAAKAIHRFSPRADRPFIAINCAALPESLLESELFGHEKGAFTGATAQKLGRFELAEGGTLLLDEIGELSMAIQSKLLRVLEEREFVRVGGTRTITCDVRIIAATNRDLKTEMQQGRFREDLYYRLNVFPVTLPPLRERIDDLPLLVGHFVAELAPSLGVPMVGVSDEAMSAMMHYPWPGNVRELRNVIERCLLLASGETIERALLPVEIAERSGSSDEAGDGNAAGATGSKLADHERALILKAMHETDWNQSAAARALGVSRDYMRYRLKKYNIRPPKR